MAAAELLLPVFFFVRAAYHCLLVTCVTINYAQLLYAHVAGSIAGLNVLLQLCDRHDLRD